jgi:HSP20 family protein
MRARYAEAYLRELAGLQRRVDELFERALVVPGFEEGEEGPPGEWSPVVDAVESPHAYHFYAELPGIAREDIHLEARGRRLELSGRRRTPPDAAGFLRLERAYGAFRRSFELAETLDGDGIEARFERGLLEVTVPKKQSGARRRIAVEQGEG